MTMLGRRAFLGAIAAAPAILRPRLAGAGTNDHDNDVMAAPGQISNSDLQASDVYYWSGDITDQVRNQWNDYVAKYRDVWNTTHPRFFIDINSTTQVRLGHPSHNHAPWIESSDAEEVANALATSQDGVLRFCHRDGWLSEKAPYRNYKHVGIRLLRRQSHSKWDTSSVSYNDHHLDNVDYESGFTFWQGGTPKWLNRNNQTALWQIQSETGAVIYFKVSSTGKFAGFTRPKPNASTQSFATFSMTTGHDDVHVLCLRYRFGSGGYLRIWYNGALKVNVARPMTGFRECSAMFMNYSGNTGSTERILYMDRCYSRAL